MLKSKLLRSTLTLAVIVLSAGLPAFAADIPVPVAAGKSVTIDASSEGTKPIKYEFFRDQTKVHEVDGDTASFLIGSMAAENAGAYWVKATNPFGSSTSANRIVLSVGIPPSPPILGVTIGGTRMVSKKNNVHYVAQVDGDAAGASYQWEKNGVPLSGETGSTLDLSFVNPSYEGKYAVVVRKGAAAVRSNESQLWVLRN